MIGPNSALARHSGLAKFLVGLLLGLCLGGGFITRAQRKAPDAPPPEQVVIRHETISRVIVCIFSDNKNRDPNCHVAEERSLTAKDMSTPSTSRRRDP